jgi:NADH-quinone oxidoreductase subunit H
MNTITMSAIIVTLFLGGPAGPDWFGVGWLSGTIWFALKLFVFLFIFVWIRATLPRFRYDQLMNIGWKVMIPLALGWVLLLATINISRDEGWEMWAVLPVTFLVLVAGWVTLFAAVDVAQRRRAAAVDDEVLT